MSGKFFSQKNAPPLEQIRKAEMESKQHLARAKREAERRFEEVESEVSRLKEAAREEGVKKGLEEYDAIISKAKEEAKVRVEKAQQESERLRKQGQNELEDAFKWAVEFVLGSGGEGVGK